MERNREANRGNTAAVNGIELSRWRHRITALRDSFEEEGQVELQERVRSRERERVHKVDRVRDRDQDLVSHRKRRRLERCLERSVNQDVERGDAKDSPGLSREETYEEYEELSSSMSNHSLLRTVTPTTNFRSMSGLRISYEMIGAAVPRRARSASVKRLNEQWNSSHWGFAEWQSRRRILPSPSGENVYVVSPLSSSVSRRRKTKPLGPSKVPLPSVEDDIEIEVVEALFDLMKQSQSQFKSQCSKEDETIRESTYRKNLNLIGNKDCGTKSVRSPAVSAQIGSDTSDVPPGINSPSIASPEAAQKELSAESELKLSGMSSGSLERTEGFSLEKGKHSSELKPLVGGDQAEVAKEEESRSCAKSNADGSADPTVSKANLESEVTKPKREADFEIDLMAPLSVPSSVNVHGSNILVRDFKLDLEKAEKENVSSCCNNNSEQRDPKKPNRSMFSDSERQNFGQSSSLPSSDMTTGRPGGFPLSGFKVHLKSNFPMDESSTNAALQLPPFTLSEPWSKRCVTHQYIAFNIRHHQQLTMNRMRPAVTCANLHEAKPCDVNPTTSVSNSFLGNSVAEDLPSRHDLATPFLGLKDKNSDVASTVDAVKRKQLVLQQTSDQAPAGNLLQHALNFPLGQHQTANALSQQPGLNKSATVISKAVLSNNSAGGSALGSSSFPAAAAAVSFNLSNLPTNDTPPFMAMLQSNMHPYPISANGGMPLLIKGTQTPALPFLDASYYPPMFWISQNQQKQFACQPLSTPLYQVLQASPISGTSSVSKSSHKQSKSQQLVAQTSSHNSFSLEGLQLQQIQKQHVLGSHSYSKSLQSAGSRAQIASSDQNYGSPLQTMNFSLVSHRDGNYQQSGSDDDGKMALLAKSVDQSLNFSKLDSGNPSASAVNEVAFDNGSAQTRSYIPPSNTGNQYVSSCSTAPTAAFSVTAPKSQQQHLQKQIIQLQKQQTLQMQLTGTAQVQASVSNNFCHSFIGCDYPNNNPLFSLVHKNNFFQSSQWKNGSIAITSEVPSLATTSSLKNPPQQQSRNSQGQPHMSFGSSLNSATLSQGKQFLMNSQPSSIVDGQSSISGGSQYLTAVAELQPQQKALSNKPSQKSIPACGRDVPSVLSTCTSQLSELKH